MSIRSKVIKTLQTISNISCSCPAHSNNSSVAPLQRTFSKYNFQTGGKKEYAFEMACSTIRYGPGVTQEVGMEFKHLGLKKVCLMTDPNLANMAPVKAAAESLTNQGVKFEMYDRVRVEPTNESFQEAINFARQHLDIEGFVAVGGGSVIDTTKAANLYSCNPEADFLNYVNAPIGLGHPIQQKTLKPLIAIPTTAGTGSETTGVAIFDYLPLKAKTGIANRALRPTLGLIDPQHTLSMPTSVASYSGFDVLCHALESYTALPYTMRERPPTSIQRPAYQGSNPISDVWSLQTLRLLSQVFLRSVRDPNDIEARSLMHLASAYAGVGFGNAGVHLCHALSYPISGLVKSYRAKDYPVPHPLIPHGLSVVITAPAVFQFTAPACPERHLCVAETLGIDTTRVKREDAGLALADGLRKIMQELNVENGLRALGFSHEDIPKLVAGTLPQERVTKLSPMQHTQENLAAILENSMTIY